LRLTRALRRLRRFAAHRCRRRRRAGADAKGSFSLAGSALRAVPCSLATTQGGIHVARLLIGERACVLVASFAAGVAAWDVGEGYNISEHYGAHGYLIHYDQNLR
jgi:hypothetical protein